MERITKNAFCVIGKLGSTDDGADIVEKLWNNADEHFDEVKDLAKIEDGKMSGIWGIMSRMDYSFLPWEDDYSKGRYMAGIECVEDAYPPTGWKKWIVPGFEYIKVKVTGPNTFRETLAQLEAEGETLVGSVHDYIDPSTNEKYMMFPVVANNSKDELIKRVREKTKQIAPCGFHCVHCFFSQWCGGCRSACNVCSFATVNDDNMCENMRCTKERGYDGCYECPDLKDCKKGFYGVDKEGDGAKASALFIARYGEKTYEEAMNKAMSTGDKYMNALNECPTAEDRVALLAKYI